MRGGVVGEELQRDGGEDGRKVIGSSMFERFFSKTESSGAMKLGWREAFANSNGTTDSFLNAGNWWMGRRIANRSRSWQPNL
jgi:hypothetical protein